MIFEKDQIINTEGKMFQAICVDEEIAVFAPVKRVKKDNCIRTSYNNMIAFPNQDEFKDTLAYETVDVIL